MSATTKVAVVTGAASGIGAATCARLLADGWRVAAVDLEKSPGDERLLGLRADISDGEQVRSALEEVVATWGRIDAMVNSAAITLPTDGAILSVDDDVFDRVIAVNLRGTFLMCKHALPALIETGGAIVNVSSAAAAMGLSSTAYPASKGGVNALSRAIAHQVAEHGVRCTAIMPGLVDTPMLAVAAQKPGSSARSTPGVIDRKANPAEIADLIAYLVSDRARFVTGGAIAIDGGLTKY